MDIQKYEPKIKVRKGAKVIVSGPIAVKTDNPNLTVERKS